MRACTRPAQDCVIGKGDVVVCVLTGHGLKGPDRATAFSPKTVTVKAEVKEGLKAPGY